MLNTYQVLEQIAGYWDEMTASEQSSLALTIANKTQMEVFSSVVSNFTTAQNALNTSIESEGSALEENNKILDTIQGKTKLFRSQLEELVLGDGGLQDAYKRVLDFGIALLKFANSDVGQAIIKISLLSVTVLSLVKAFTSLERALQITAKFKEVNRIIQLCSKYQLTLGTTIKGVVSVFNLQAIAMTAVIAVLYLAVKAYKYFTEAQKRASEAYDESLSKVEEYKDEIDDLKEKIKEVNKLKIETTDETALRNLELQSIEYERQLKILQEKKKIQDEQAKTKADELWGANTKATYFSAVDVGEYGSYDYDSDYMSLGEAFEKEINSLEEVSKRQDELLAKRAEMAKAGDTESDSWKRLNAQINVNQAYIEKQREDLSLLTEDMQKVADSTSKNSGKASELLTKYTDLIDYTTRLTEAQTEVAQSLQSTDDVYEKLGKTADEVVVAFGEDEDALNSFYQLLADGNYAQAYGLAVGYCTEQTEDFQEAIEEVMSSMQSLEDAYSTLTSVAEEYNSGNLTLDTLDTLLTKYPEYIQYLQLENGQLSVNKDAIDEIANARIKDAEMLAYQAYLKEEDRIATLDGNSAIAEASTVTAQFVNATQSQWNALKDIIDALNVGTEAWDNYWSSASKTTYKTGSAKASLHEKNLNNLKTNLSLLEKATSANSSFTRSIDANTKATKGNTSAKNENNKATEEQIEQLESLISEYEKVIKYIDSKFDQEIDRIKDLKDAELDSIDARIDALEELRDAELDAIEDQIDALEKENDALSDQLELQELLNNLAKAKSSKVKIYRNGQFVYDQDFEQVNEAQQALNEYNAKKRLQDQIDALNDYKDQVKKNYDKQIDDLKAYQKEREKYYDAQIKYWQDYKQKFNDMVNAYDEEQNRLKALELTGIDFEAQGWQTRLGNLQNFVNNYISLLNQLTEAKKKAQAEEYASSTSVDTSNGGSGTASFAKGKYDTNKIHVSTTYQGGRQQTVKWRWNEAGNKVMLHAKGSNYIKADELAVVGEDPHKEIVIGSNLNTNSGVMMNLQKGSGVVPATATSSLMALADKVRANGVNATANDIMGGNEVTNMEIANINVNANNADEFVQSMKDFKISMLQRSYK